MSDVKKTVVVGSGSFGTALAAVFALEGEDEVTLLGRNAVLMEMLAETREHPKALPGITLPKALHFTMDPSVLKAADTIVLAVPAQAQRAPHRSTMRHILTRKRSLFRLPRALNGPPAG